jgi:hypothetical protein
LLWGLLLRVALMLHSQLGQQPGGQLAAALQPALLLLLSLPIDHLMAVLLWILQLGVVLVGLQALLQDLLLSGLLLVGLGLRQGRLH